MNLETLQQHLKEGSPWASDPEVWKAAGYEVPTLDVRSAWDIYQKAESLHAIGQPFYYSDADGIKVFSAAGLAETADDECAYEEELNEYLLAETDRMRWEIMPSRLKSIDYVFLREPQPHLVQDHILKEGWGQINGASYSGKTFVAVDLALSVCAGLETWMGAKINVEGPQKVVYVASEGGQPFWDAVEGWMKIHPDADLTGLLVLDGGLGDRLILNKEEMELARLHTADKLPTRHSFIRFEQEFRQAYGADVNPVLMIIDPQINVLQGVDENSNTDMIEVLSALQSWSKANGIMTINIHHTGKKSEGASDGGRGASGQFGLADVSLKLSKDTKGKRTLEFQKVKGAPNPMSQVFTLETIRIDHGSGKSAIIVRDDEAKSGKELEEAEWSQREGQIMDAISKGAMSVSKIAAATKIDHRIVTAFLEDLVNKGSVRNTGTKFHPKLEVVNPITQTGQNSAVYEG